MDTGNFRSSNLKNIEQSLKNYGRPFRYSQSLKHRNSLINRESEINNPLNLGENRPLIELGETVKSPNIKINKSQEGFISRNSNLSTNNSNKVRLSEFFNSRESNTSTENELRQKKNNVLLAVSKFTLKKNAYEIISYVLDKIYEDEETIKLLYNLIKILENQPVNSNKLNHLNRLNFIEEYISTEFHKINTSKNLSVIDQKYKILIQFFKSAYFIKISTNQSEQYQKNKKKLFNLINFAKRFKNLVIQKKSSNSSINSTINQSVQENEENLSREALSVKNLNSAMENARNALNTQNANFRNQTIALTSKLAYPMNREGFLDFTNIEYFIYSSTSYGMLTEYNELMEKSPFYYANGLFHINPIAASLFEKYKPSLEEYLKKQGQIGLESIPDYQNKNYISLANLMHSINKLNNSKYLSTLFEQNFIYNVEFNNSDFQTNFYTMCEEFNFCVDSICICKKDSKTKELEIFKSYQTTKKSPLENTKRNPIFKINLNNIKQSGGNKVTKFQTGGAIDIITCIVGASFAVSLFFAVGHCTFRKNIVLFPKNYSLCIATTTFTSFTIIAGTIIMAIKIIFWGAILLVISSPVLVSLGLFHTYKYMAQKIRDCPNPNLSVENSADPRRARPGSGAAGVLSLRKTPNNIYNIKLYKNNVVIIEIVVLRKLRTQADPAEPIGSALAGACERLQIIIHNQNKIKTAKKLDDKELIINDSEKILKLIFSDIFKTNQKETIVKKPLSESILSKIIKLCKSLNNKLDYILDTVIITNNGKDTKESIKPGFLGNSNNLIHPTLKFKKEFIALEILIKILCNTPGNANQLKIIGVLLKQYRLRKYDVNLLPKINSIILKNSKKDLISINIQNIQKKISIQVTLVNESLVINKENIYNNAKKFIENIFNIIIISSTNSLEQELISLSQELFTETNGFINNLELCYNSDRRQLVSLTGKETNNTRTLIKQKYLASKEFLAFKIYMIKLENKNANISALMTMYNSAPSMNGSIAITL